MTVKDPFRKVRFSLKVIQLKCDQVASDFNSFISKLTEIFTHHTIKSCCIIHPSGVEYYLVGQSEDSEPRKDLPVLGDCVHPVTWKGYVELRRHDLRRHWRNLIRIFWTASSRKSSYCAIWGFDEDPNFIQLIGVDRNIKLNETSFPSSIHSFSFGNIINGNRFVIHFGTSSNKSPVTNSQDSRKTEISVEDIKMKHNYNKLKFVLKFNLETATSIGSTMSKYRLVYDYKSIKRVHVCLDRAFQIRLYLQLLYPPRVFIKVPKSESGVSKRIRTSHCGNKLSSYIIGVSDVLRLTMNIEDDSIITTLYRWQKYHYFDICYVSFNEYLRKPVKPQYSQSFPFSVNYALTCIYSIGYNFVADLKKNYGEGEDIYGLILKYIKDEKVELIVEALYRLFDEYLVGKVYNAIDHLKVILSKIESKQVNELNDSRTVYNFNRQSWAIVTPTRTIFTPPVPCDTTEYKTDHLIRTIVRDEDIDLAILLNRNLYGELDNHIPFTKRSSVNNRFLSDVIGQKLLASGCLDIAGQSFHLPGSERAHTSEFKKGHRILIKSG